MLANDCGGGRCRCCLDERHGDDGVSAYLIENAASRRATRQTDSFLAAAAVCRLAPKMRGPVRITPSDQVMGILVKLSMHPGQIN